MQECNGQKRKKVRWYHVLAGLLLSAYAVMGLLLYLQLKQENRQQQISWQETARFQSDVNHIQNENALRDNSCEAFSPQPLTIQFLSVGQGDAALITCGGDAMLIDAGPDDKGTFLQMILRRQGISSLKYLIATHLDEDHIGGMDVVLYKFPTELVIRPVYEKQTAANRNLQDTIRERGIDAQQPVSGMKYQLGDASFTLFVPDTDFEEGNNHSTAVLLQHGEKRFLFAGDAQQEEELELCESGCLQDVDVYQVNHHGSSTSSCEFWLDAITPEYAVISCGKDNRYGYPRQDVLCRLEQRNITIYRTDLSGTVTVISDGENLVWSVEEP